MHLYGASLSNKRPVYQCRTSALSVCICFLELLWIKPSIMKLMLSAAWYRITYCCGYCMLYWLWQAAFHLNYPSNSITFPFSGMPIMFKDNEFSSGRYTCQHVCLREVRRLKTVGRTWHIRNKETYYFNNKKKTRWIKPTRSVHILTSISYVFITIPSLRPDFIITKPHYFITQPHSFLLVAASWLFNTTDIFSYRGESQWLFALWDMTYVTTYKNMVYLASLILLFGTSTHVFKNCKTCVFPKN